MCVGVGVRTTGKNQRRGKRRVERLSETEKAEYSVGGGGLKGPAIHEEYQ